MGISGQGLTSPLESGVVRFVGALRSTLVRPVLDRMAAFSQAGKLTAENERLREENERLQTELAQLRNAAARNEELQQLLQLRQKRPEAQFLMASTIGRDSSNLHAAIAIDRGGRDGIRTGMVVLSPGGALIGSVTRVRSDHAWVRLLSDPNSAVTAVAQSSRATGVVTGNYQRQLKLALVPQSTDIKTGDVIETTGLGSTYPPGLVIGKVSRVEGTRQDLFKEIEIEPLADLTRLDQVLVLLNFQPARLEGP